MKITKYPQSTFLIESGPSRILIDPGLFTIERFTPDHFEPLTAIFISHQHFDHLSKAAVNYWSNQGIPIFGNRDVQKFLAPESIGVRTIAAKKEFEVSGFKITPLDLPHCKMLWCGSCKETIAGTRITTAKRCRFHPSREPEQIDGPPNTGFLINEVSSVERITSGDLNRRYRAQSDLKFEERRTQGGLFFHPGDGIELTGLKVDTAAIPITGPTIDYNRAWDLAKGLNVQKIIPMHYSNPTFPADPKEFSKLKPVGTKVIILKDGQSFTLTGTGPVKFTGVS